MPFTIAPVEPDDIHALTIIQWAALTNNPLIQTLYPKGPTLALADFTTSSYEKALRYPSVRLIKAIDDETGQIVAFAKWLSYRQDRIEPSESISERGAGEAVQGDDEWRKTNKRSTPPDCYGRALNDWNGRITTMRKGILGNRRHVCRSPSGHTLECYFACYSPNLWGESPSLSRIQTTILTIIRPAVLDIIHTHPSQQERGAGTQLLKWGTDMADKEGSQCYLESSPVGYSLFEKCGFDDVTEMDIDLGKYREGFGEYKHTVMIRPPFGEQRPQIPQKDERLEQIGTLPEVEEEQEEEQELEQEGEGPSYTSEARMLHFQSSSSLKVG